MYVGVIYMSYIRRCDGQKSERPDRARKGQAAVWGLVPGGSL